MPVFVKDNTYLLFAHIPKTGGSSVASGLQAAGWETRLHHRRGVGDAELQRVRVCSPQHFHGALLKAQFRLDRFAASFTVTRHPVDRITSEYTRLKDRRGDTAPGIDEWVADALERVVHDPYASDNHLRPQVDFLVSGMTVHRFEDGLDRVFAWLGSVAGEELGEAPKVHFSRSDRPMLSSAVIEQVESFYAADMAEFGYETHAGVASG